MRPFFLVCFLGILPVISIAQRANDVDSLSLNELDEVVITGQINPQSVDKSVVEVQVISQEMIQRQAGNNLADILNTTALNLSITPNTSNGKSQVSLFGLDGQYFKVLIDNVPVINEEGVGNNTDLTLINLDDIQQIEIVEGAMGVQYGSNALAGIINVITKKKSKYQWELNTYFQEETVGNEYSFKDQGRHIQSFKIGRQISDEVYTNVGYFRNDFKGFFGQKKGSVYDQNDGLRGYEWLPKTQNNLKALLAFNKEKFNLFYRFDYLNEDIDRYNTNVDLNENPATNTFDPLAQDERYTNNRFYHHFNGVGKISNSIPFNISLSYQKQVKELERYTYRIRPGIKENIEKGQYQSRQAIFSRGTFSDILNNSNIRFQAGYELTLEEGTGSSLSISIDPSDSEVSQSLNNYDLFSSAEWNLSDNFILRPGVRVSLNNLFTSQVVGSLSALQKLNNGWELRTVIGSANRTPNYDELYTYFVDVNHDVQGNPDLDPERGFSAFFHLKKQFLLSDRALRMKNKVSLNYLGLNDRIELIVVQQNPLAFQYRNIDSYKAIGVFTDNTLHYDNFKTQLGASLQGISKILDSRTNSLNNFLFNLKINANSSYIIRNWNTTLSLFYRYIGRSQQFVEKTNAEGNQEFQIGETEAYSWMDATIMKKFKSGRIIATLGSRNIFNVINVASSAFEGGAHNGPPSQIPIGYGRSLFLRLTYNLEM